MSDSTRANFDNVFSMAGDSGQRARDLAGKVREDLRSGADRLRSGTEQFRSQGSRTITDIGRLVRAEVDAGLTRIGVATQADIDDLNLRLEHSEEEIRELRMRLAEAESRAARKPEPLEADPAETAVADADELGGEG
ncbi:phasin family protein [Glycomyces sp. L485]|uniref:phasin family protein n=1 Tax=Glycomyces sp. L485 TaxID=2909235 RepID=UPI001F4AEDA0|nr:phasin family protein [Glycomyces sp. L485]MCH7229766.1 phasin family protein [Glycomyces sp. L485]